MSEQDKGPGDEDLLFPYHIVRGEQHPEAVRADIADLLAAARFDLRGSFRAIQAIEESQAVLRMVSIGVLSRLHELQAEEVNEVVDDLLEMDEPDPIMNNLSSLASRYDIRWYEALDSSERERMRRMTVFTHAAFAISVVAAVHSREPSGTAEDSASLYAAAAEAVGNTSEALSPESYNALRTVLWEVHEDIELP
jgi:hypothetical protein